MKHQICTSTWHVLLQKFTSESALQSLVKLKYLQSLYKTTCSCMSLLCPCSSGYQTQEWSLSRQVWFSIHHSTYYWEARRKKDFSKTSFSFYLTFRKKLLKTYQEVGGLLVCLIKWIVPNMHTRINHSNHSSSHPSDSEYKHRKDIFTSFLPV